MTGQSILVTTGSRLHFGLTRFRAEHPARFSGMGVMIESPATVVRISPANRFGTNDHRCQEFCERWSRESGSILPACFLSVESRPAEHSGFGSGTQMAHAVVTALDIATDPSLASQAITDNPSSSGAERIARRMDRGRRSMIGSYGFSNGGLLVDGTDEQGNPALRCQMALPEEWRLVLVLPVEAKKKFGLQEQAAFDNILAEQELRSQQLESLIENAILPAARNADFGAFTQSVHDYGKLSGEYYQGVQGGIYNGPVVTALVESLQRLGGSGIGQSSWGPVVFSWCQDSEQAEFLLKQISQEWGDSVATWASQVRNQPATVSIEQSVC